MPDESLITGIAALLGLSAAQARGIRLEPCATGGNNRVYRATLPGRTLAVKQYFRHPSDPRDRLHSEDAFLRYAETAGIACVPGRIAADAQLGLGIHEFVEGDKLTLAGISAARVEEAAGFFLRLNAPAYREAARTLPRASEACFTIAEHFSLVDGRIARLAAIDDGAAREFAGDLAAAWDGVKRRIARDAAARGEALETPVAERCVSPSDFGFHNALVRKSGEVCFLDFEYAGWDDPAKMVGDFFSHPAVPVGPEHFDGFLRATMGYSPQAPALEARARLLFPVFQAKWCCIMLNDFVPDFARRRRFADPGVDENESRRRQLGKARQLLASMQL
jgi:Phosphotransferase enzyme family